MAQVTYNEAEFRRELGRIAAFSGKALVEVIQQQAALFTQDASTFTPPFGKAPVKEGGAAKKKIGMIAVKRDIYRAFTPIENLRVYNITSGIAGEYGKALRRATRKKDAHLVTELLNNAHGRLKGRNAVVAPTVELHNQMRNRRGGVTKTRSLITLSGDAALRKFVKQKQEGIGLGKAGWNDPLHGLQRTAFAWVEKQTRSRGVFREEGGTTPSITVGNQVPFVQDSASRIEDKAWNNRMRNATKQAAILERAARKKMRDLGIPTS